MRERIKTIRKHFNLTQQDLADKLGVKRGAIANYEIGRNDPVDAVISLICREFHVNEHWLRTGEGEMLEKLDEDQELVEFMTDLLHDCPESFRRRFISVVSKLDANGWAVLEQIAEEITKK